MESNIKNLITQACLSRKNSPRHLHQIFFANYYGYRMGAGINGQGGSFDPPWKFVYLIFSALNLVNLKLQQSRAGVGNLF